MFRPAGQKDSPLLCYVHWFDKSQRSTVPGLRMHVTERLVDDGVPRGSIVELSKVRQLCPLYPLFGPVLDKALDYRTILEDLTHYLINPFHSKLDYDTFKRD